MRDLNKIRANALVILKQGGNCNKPVRIPCTYEGCPIFRMGNRVCGDWLIHVPDNLDKNRSVAVFNWFKKKYTLEELFTELMI